MSEYIGMVSSDWSQCLSPSGPFDAFVFHYPELETDLKRIFRSYTATEISLSQAADQVVKMLPSPLTIQQMDDYLEARFEMYRGVDQLIRWCRDHRIVFMINTTAFMGYFQRVLAKSLLPAIAVLSAQSILRYGTSRDDPEQMIDLREIEDKAANTAAVANMYQIPADKLVLMGDSGGDGPHFKWGSLVGATLIGSMTKPSLSRYCRNNGLLMHHQFGRIYAPGEKISLEKERGYNFLELTDVIGQVIGV